MLKPGYGRTASALIPSLVKLELLVCANPGFPEQAINILT